MKIYTRTGDDGTTGLRGGGRVRKDDPRLEAYGTVDELNSTLGVVIAQLPIAAHKARPWLDTIQSDLFAVGARLASTEPPAEGQFTLDPARVSALEQEIDQMDSELPPLKNFILPQGNPCTAFAHVARAVARRAERRVVAFAAVEAVEPAILAYLNRLTDFLFVLARWINRHEGGGETAWIPSGKVKGSTAAGVPGPDRLEATLGKLDQDKKKRETLFEKAAAELQKKKEQSERAFRKSVDQINKDGGKVEPPPSPFDWD